MDREQVALDYLENTAPSLTDLAKRIWDHPEIGLMEKHASDLIAGELERNGFSVTRGSAGIPTAFVASWGTGGPTIGILGEYDALPGLSQKVTPIREPVEEGAPGHACGHNLLGVASMGAALAAKHAMEHCQIPGTIRYYGCPAEETLIGKVFMARAGVFNDLDAVLSWHPSCLNTAKRTV
ncbi:MAG: amidohydrolase, partial [Anaerolineae bacterium]|nr:amidohydrolase [Anaerolineae bacterium]